MLGKLGIAGIIVLALGVLAFPGAGSASLILIVPGLAMIGIAIARNKRKNRNLPSAQPMYQQYIQSRTPVSYPQANISATGELPQRIFSPAPPSYYSRLRRRFIAVDFETSGLSPNQDRIIEIGAVLFENGLQKDSFSCLVQSVNHIPASASAVNHITDEMLRNYGLPERAAFDQFLNFLGEEVFTGFICLVSHNTGFDMNFLKNTLDRLGYVLSGDIRYFDTLSLSRKHLSLPNYKQETVAQYYGLNNPAAHRAVTDAQICGQIMLRLFKPMGIELDTQPIPRSYSPTGQDRLICAQIRQALQQIGIDTRCLRFEKHRSGSVWAKAPRDFCCFRTSNGKILFAIDRRDYVGSSLPTRDQEYNMAGMDMVEVEVKELQDIALLAPSFAAGFRRVYPELAEFYSLNEWVRRDAEKSFVVE